MSSWAKIGRPALFKALEAACDQIDADLAAELEDRDKGQHSSLLEEVTRLKKRLASLEQFEQENRVLRKEVTELRSQAHATQVKSTEETRKPLGEIPANEVHNVRRKHGQIPGASTELGSANTSNDHVKLTAKCARLQRLLDEGKEINRRWTDECKKWQKYAESLERKVEKLETKQVGSGRILPSSSSTLPRGSPRSSDSNRTLFLGHNSRALDGHVRSSASDTGLVSNTKAERAIIGLGEDARNKEVNRAATLAAPGSHPRVLHRVPDVPESHPEGDGVDNVETQDDLPQLPRSPTSAAVVRVKEEPSSDPIVVSEKKVAKRKRAPEDEEVPLVRKLKREETGSDPVITSETRRFLPQESIDLDRETTDILLTPRKRRHEQDAGAICERPWKSAPDMSAPSASQDAQTGTHLAASDIPVAHTAHPPPVGHTTQPVLMLPRISGTGWSTPGPTKRTHDLRNGVASLAEDGYDPSRTPGRTPHTEPTTSGRLDALLQPRHLQQEPLSRPRSKLGANGAQALELLDVDSEVPRRMLPWLTAGTRTSHSPSEGAGRLRRRVAETHVPKSTEDGDPSAPLPRLHTPRPAHDAQRPLRKRPASELHLNDFKINPKYNDGYSFAFNEVVRNKDDRAELAGCTDPACCGKFFHNIAEAERQRAGAALHAREEAIRLLEDFLGDEAHRLGSMGREERDKLWVEARVRELANKYGRHRHRYTRASSPPGFWTADFPNTQEAAKDRDEADKMERMMVEDRWREAMRKGGRFLFRDE